MERWRDLRGHGRRGREVLNERGPAGEDRDGEQGERQQQADDGLPVFVTGTEYGNGKEGGPKHNTCAADGAARGTAAGDGPPAAGDGRDDPQQPHDDEKRVADDERDDENEEHRAGQQ